MPSPILSTFFVQYVIPLKPDSAADFVTPFYRWKKLRVNIPK